MSVVGAILYILIVAAGIQLSSGLPPFKTPRSGIIWAAFLTVIIVLICILSLHHTHLAW